MSFEGCLIVVFIRFRKKGCGNNRPNRVETGWIGFLWVRIGFGGIFILENDEKGYRYRFLTSHYHKSFEVGWLATVGSGWIGLDRVG